MNRIELVPIDSKECETLVRTKLREYFPMCIEYFDKSDLYTSDKVEWHQVILPDIAYVPCALVCFMEDNDSLHLSVFEVSKPCRRNGRGTEIMKKLIKVAQDAKYHSFTLRLRSPELKSFYTQFGFVPREDYEGIEYYELKLGY